jgi:hypothetical protein
LVIAVDEVLQRWKDDKPETISDKPLPDPDLLNASIPVAEWETGLDGQPRKPWEHTVQVYLVHPGLGEFYTYSSATYGGHIAYDILKQSVVTMRALRGARVMPLVELTERPMKTRFGLKNRPHFHIMDWKTPGGGAALSPAPPTLQLPSAAAPSSAAPEPAPTPTPASSPTPAPPPARPRTKSRIKSQVRLAKDTLIAMGDVKPVGLGEILDDEIPFGGD